VEQQNRGRDLHNRSGRLPQSPPEEAHALGGTLRFQSGGWTDPALWHDQPNPAYRSLADAPSAIGQGVVDREDPKPSPHYTDPRPHLRAVPGSKRASRNGLSAGRAVRTDALPFATRAGRLAKSIALHPRPHEPRYEHLKRYGAYAYKKFLHVAFYLFPFAPHQRPDRRHRLQLARGVGFQ